MVRRIYIIPIYGSQDLSQVSSERMRVGNIFDTDRQKIIINRNTEAGESTMDVLVNVDTFAGLDDSANKVVVLTTSATAPMRTVTQSPLDNSTKVATTAYVDAAIVAGATDNLSTVLSVGNSATGQNITTLQQIYNIVASKQNTLYLDSTNALQMYMAGVNVNSNWLIKGETNSGTTLPTISLSVYDILGGTPYVTGMTIAKNAVTISGTLTGTFPGAVYDADYSANYTTRSLVDKGYVTSTFAALSSGLVPLNIGGTNKNMTAVNGGIVWTDADSMEVTAAGSTGQILRSGGAAAPTWSTATYPSTASTTGAYLRAGGTNWIASTLILPNSATANCIPYATSTNTWGESSIFNFDGTNFTVGATAPVSVEFVSFQKNQNAASYGGIFNSNTGASARAGFYVGTSLSSGNYGNFAFVSSGASNGDLENIASSFLVEGNKTGGLILGASDASGPIRLFTGGVATSNERLRILSGGSVLIGYTATGAGELFGFQKNQNAATFMGAVNTTSGTGAYSGYWASQSASGSGLISMYSMSAGYTTSGIFVADAGVLGCSKTSGMNIGNTNSAQLSFWTNNTKRVDVSAAGQFTAYALGTTTSTSTSVTFTSAHYGLAYLWSPSGTATATLPANGAAAGSWFDVYVLTDQTTTISAATADTLITVNDTAADSVAFSTAGQKIGSMVRFISNGTYWIAVNLGTNTMTVAT